VQQNLKSKSRMREIRTSGSAGAPRSNLGGHPTVAYHLDP
jgi:hypothetical protein